MNVQNEYVLDDSDISLLMTSIKYIDNFLKQMFDENSPNRSNFYPIYSEFSDKLIGLWNNAYNIVARKKGGFSHVTEYDIQVILSDLSQKYTLFTSPKSQSFIATIQNFLENYDQMRDQLVDKIIASQDKEKINPVPPILREIIHHRLNQKMMSFRMMDILLPQVATKQKVDPKTEIEQDPKTEVSKLEEGLHAFVISKEDLRITIKMINDKEKDAVNKLLKIWDEFSTAYSNLDEENPKTIYALLNIIFKFHSTMVELFEDHDKIIDAFNTFGLLLLIKEKLLKPDHKKQAILEKIIRLCTVVREEKSDNIFFLVNQIIGQIGASLDKDISERYAHTNVILNQSVHNTIFTLQEKLVLTYRYGFNAPTIVEFGPSELSLDIKEYDILINFIMQNELFIEAITPSLPKIKEQIQVQETQEEEQKIIAAKYKSLKKPATPAKDLAAQHQLKMLDINGDNNHIGLKTIEEQAAFRYRVTQAKYFITPEEAKLIKNITGIEFEHLIPFKKSMEYPAGTMSYYELITAIKTKIKQYERENIDAPFFHRKRSVDALNCVHIFMHYHFERYHDYAGLNRLKDNNHKETNTNTGKLFRESISARVDKVSYFSKDKKDLKKLREIMESKTKLSNQLKAKTTLFKDKNIRAQNTYDSLITTQQNSPIGTITFYGNFFEPSLLLQAQSQLAQKLKGKVKIEPEEISEVPIDICLTHYITIQHEDIKKLIQSTNVAKSFHPKNDSALKEISAMITEIKKNKANFTVSSAKYLTALEMQIDAKVEVNNIICGDPNNINGFIVKFLNDASTTRVPLIKSSLLQKVADLQIFQDILNNGKLTPEEVAQNYNEVKLTYQNKIDNLKENYQRERDQTKGIIDIARSTLDAIKYLAIHTTGQLKGNREVKR